jgi:hypothetical protein
LHLCEGLSLTSKRRFPWRTADAGHSSKCGIMFGIAEPDRSKMNRRELIAAGSALTAMSTAAQAQMAHEHHDVRRSARGRPHNPRARRDADTRRERREDRQHRPAETCGPYAQGDVQADRRRRALRPSGEWETPWYSRCSTVGKDIDQFRKESAQVILYPPRLATGKPATPFRN